MVPFVAKVMGFCDLSAWTAPWSRDGGFSFWAAGAGFGRGVAWKVSGVWGGRGST